MAKRTPEQEASYALNWNLSRNDLKPAVQVAYDRLKAERASEIASAPPAVRTASQQEGTPSGSQQERIPSGVLVLGALLGWGPWSTAIGAWQTFGNSGYTIDGNNASISAVHSVCQAGQAELQPGICGSINAHYAFGVAMLVVGSLAFIGGMVGLFAAQQRNPKAWRQAGGPFFAGLVLGIFAVVTTLIVAIARGVRDGATSPATVQEQPINTAVSSQVGAQSSGIAASTGPMNVQWRVGTVGGWEWLASDGQWYSQQFAPVELLPPAPPPPALQH